MPYFLGVDGGGTKTHALVCNEQGNLCGFGKTGCGNFEVFGWEHAKNEILKATDGALKQARITADELSFSFFGLAGADRHYDHTMLKEKISKLHVFHPFNVKNDSFVALRGGTTNPFGVVVCSGTGTVAVGRNRQGKEFRAGGLGPDFGDTGSGTDIVKMAVRAVVRENDGRGEKTLLTQKALKIFSCRSTDELIDKNYRAAPAHGQMISVIQAVYECAAKNDNIAMGIVKKIAGEIAVSAIAVITNLNMQKESFDVVLAGSIHREKGKLLKRFIEPAVKNSAIKARIRYPVFPPVVGAALLAMEERGIKITARHYANMKKSIKIIK